MRILIEVYRKWEIFFDTEKEEFYTVSNEFDTDKTKRSFASTKKYIDDYIKENQEFKPVWVQNERNSFDKERKVKLIGIRKDGAFMCEDVNGNKSQFSKYNESDYFLVNAENDPIFEQINKLDEQRDELLQKMKELRKNLTKVTVKKFKADYLGTEE